MTQPTRTDAQLVQAWLQGDRDARDRVLEAWAPTVLAWCMRLGGPRVDPHDAAQDVMIVLLTRGHRCKDIRRFDAFVYGVTRKIILKHRTRTWIKRWVGMTLPDRPDRGPGPQVRAQISETGKRVQQVLERLSGGDRDVLVLCDLEGRSGTEVAALLEVPLGTVKSRLRRARERFQREATRLALAVPMQEAVAEGMGH